MVNYSHRIAATVSGGIDRDGAMGLEFESTTYDYRIVCGSGKQWPPIPLPKPVLGTIPPPGVAVGRPVGDDVFNIGHLVTLNVQFDPATVAFGQGNIKNNGIR